MGLRRFATSEGFFSCWEPLSSPEISSFFSIRGRGMAVMNFFEKLTIVPLAFLYKICKTIFSIIFLVLSLAFLMFTLCAVSSARKFFIKRISSLVADLADWIFWPIGVLFCLGRLALAATVHPAVYYRS